MRQAPHGPNAPRKRSHPALVAGCAPAPERARTLRSQGFTLIELIVVVIVIGILSGISVAAYSAFAERTAESAAQTSIAEFARETSTKAILRGDGVFTPGDVEAAAKAISQAAGAPTVASAPGVYAEGLVPFTAVADGTSQSTRQISYRITDRGTKIHFALFVREGRCAGASLTYRGEPETELYDADGGCRADRDGVAELSETTPTVTTAPTLSGTRGDREVRLNWSAVTDPAAPVTGYRVFQGAQGRTPTPLTLLPAGQLQYRVTGLQNGTTYDFQVAAVSAGGDGPRSNTFQETPQGGPAGADAGVAPPGSFTATATASGAELSWTPSPTPGVRYRVFQDGVALPDVFGLSYTAKNLDRRTYVFRVFAVVTGPGGTELLSSDTETPPAQSVTPGAGSETPRLFKGLPLDGAVKLTWQAPASGQPLNGYQITHTGRATPLLLGPEAVETTLTGLQNDETIQVTLRAVGENGALSDPVTISVTPFVNSISPPRSLAGVAGDAQLTLNWAPPTTGTPVSYQVFQDGVELRTVPASQTSLTLTGLTNNRNYTYFLTAKDAAGVTSPRSSSITLTPRITLTEPQNLVATPGDRVVGLAWNAPARGTPTGYRVFRTDSTAPIATVATTTYQVTGLSNFETYSFYVVAVDADGNVSGPSATVSATPTGPPNAPQNLQGTAGDATVALTWAAPSGLSPVEGYTIYGDGVILGTATATERSFTATNLVNFRQYSFQVTAFSTAGESPRSNTVIRTPFKITPPSLVVRPGDTAAYLSIAVTPGQRVNAVTLQRDGADVQTLPVVDDAIVYPIEKGLQNATEYTWTATATNPFGTSVLSQAVKAVPVQPPTAFAAPTAARPVSAPGFTASWSEPSAPPAAPVTSYDLLRCPSGGDQPGRIFCTPLQQNVAFTAPGTARSFSESAAPVREDVSYLIASYNGGYRDFFNRYPATMSPASPLIAQGAPDAPAEVLLTTTTVPLVGTKTNAVSWQHNAFPAAAPLTGFRVYVCAGPAACGPNAAGATVVNLGAAARTYADPTTYTATQNPTYAVLAQFTNGAIVSSSAAVPAAATPTTQARPASPAPSAAAPAGAATIQVGWSAPAPRTPRTPEITTYDVYACSQVLTGTPRECYTQSVAGSTRSATFTDVVPGTYSVRVVARGTLPGLAGITSVTVS